MDDIVVIVLILCSAATVQAGLHAWANRWRGPSHAERVLAKRYAKGEINEGEYVSRVSLLRELTPGAP